MQDNYSGACPESVIAFSRVILKNGVNVTSLAPLVNLKNLIIILLRTLAIAGNRSYLDKRASYLSLNTTAAREA